MKYNALAFEKSFALNLFMNLTTPVQYTTSLKYCNHTMTPCWLLCQKPHIFCLNTLPGSIVIPTFFHHKLKHAKMRYDSEWREITSIFHSAIMIYFQFHLSKLQQHV